MPPKQQPKKKKANVNNSARGFATVSIPKKVVEAPLPIEPGLASSPDDASKQSSATRSDTRGEALSKGGNEAVPAALDAETQALQDLVDKLQEKTEKEIVRTLKSIEVDRRLSASFQSVDIDQTLRSRILDLARKLPEDSSDRPASDERDYKALSMLGHSYGTLRRLGFTEDRVNECLKSIPGVKLEEAFHWLYLHCSEGEIMIGRAEVARNASARANRTPQTPVPLAKTKGGPGHTSKTLGNSPTPTGASTRPHSRTSVLSFDHTNDRGASSSPQTPTMAQLTCLEESSSGSDSDEDPNVEYARVKTRLLGAAHSPASSSPSAKRLGARLEALKGHYFFKQAEADALVRSEQRKLQQSALEARLGNVTRVTPAPISLQIQPTLPPGASEPSTPAETTASDEGDTMFGTMLDEMPTEETSADGVVVTVRDMTLPKHWAGRTPKTLLQETVQKSDQYAAISFRIISGASRAVRAALTIRYSGLRTDEWEMTDAGCYDEAQAQQYIATITLHALTFVPQPGFVSGGTGSAVHSHFRLLPSIFRDVWDELEQKRKASENETNRSIWRKLRDILDAKARSMGKVATRIIRAVETKDDIPLSSAHQDPDPTVSEQLMRSFQDRQASPTYQSMLPQRNSLPIAAYRYDILDALESSQIIVLSGETGCGKSTQVPSFILEAQLSRGIPCKVFVTEPRRISAVTLAQRVSRELGDHAGAVGTMASLVGYSIRLESNTCRNTRLTFCTNGIALRMLEAGSGRAGKGTAFDDITHIVIDEVHERSIESDFLMIVLKSLLEQRKDLKVILMSATMDSEKISAFFGGCPTFNVPGRTFPVEVQYLEDAIEYTGWSIDERSQYAVPWEGKGGKGRKYRQAEWSEDSLTTAATIDDEDDPQPDATQAMKLGKRYSPSTAATVNLLDQRLILYDLIIRILERLCFEDRDSVAFSAAILVFMPGLNEIRRLNEMLVDHRSFDGDAFRIYPLHSSISSENQSAAFEIPPHGVRKIVIATNIAETGITIPDVTCVIDSGRHREMRHVYSPKYRHHSANIRGSRFYEKRQTSSLVETFIARSNAAQRRGRAGRVQNGLCFHLFTKQRHDTQLAEHPLPEMLRLSLSDLALRIKILKVDIGKSIEDALSRALDPPSSVNIQRAVATLVEVKALTSNEEITPMGRLLSKLPTDVHLGKFLLTSAVLKCLDPALTIVATLNSKSPFLSPFGYEDEAAAARNGFKNLQQIEELRQQLLSYLIDSGFMQVDKAYQQELSRMRFGRRKTHFIAVPSEYDVNGEDNVIINAALCTGLYPKILCVDPATGALRTLSNNRQAAFHPSSVNFDRELLKPERIRKPRETGVNFWCFFNLLHTKTLFASETGPVDNLAMLLMCGDAEFKLVAESASVDRKIEYRFPPKTSLALKILREQLVAIVALRMRGKVLDESQVEWFELALQILKRVKILSPL
ncbi:hypothetical protein FRB96_002810 [Tulasnella sp. 330]|nr:hypothetical protein FRB96_002810 [Tulasnella sp. 330]KAG8874774.1 hypothetical protein FRB97_005649 [Tulasnella sp. 331]